MARTVKPAFCARTASPRVTPVLSTPAVRLPLRCPERLQRPSAARLTGMAPPHGARLPSPSPSHTHLAAPTSARVVPPSRGRCHDARRRQPHVRQDALDHVALLDDRDEPHAPIALRAREHIPASHVTHQRRPIDARCGSLARWRLGSGAALGEPHVIVCARGGVPRTRRVRRLRGLRRRPLASARHHRLRRHHHASPRRVRREHAVVPQQRPPRRRHQRRQPRHELHRLHDAVGLARTANLFVEQSACTRTARPVHSRRSGPCVERAVRAGRAVGLLIPSSAVIRPLRPLPT